MAKWRGGGMLKSKRRLGRGDRFIRRLVGAGKTNGGVLQIMFGNQGNWYEKN